jgi:hypothetical protein
MHFKSSSGALRHPFRAIRRKHAPIPEVTVSDGEGENPRVVTALFEEPASPSVSRPSSQDPHSHSERPHLDRQLDEIIEALRGDLPLGNLAHLYNTLESLRLEIRPKWRASIQPSHARTNTKFDQATDLFTQQFKSRAECCVDDVGVLEELASIAGDDLDPQVGSRFRELPFKI